MGALLFKLQPQMINNNQEFPVTGENVSTVTYGGAGLTVASCYLLPTYCYKLLLTVPTVTNINLLLPTSKNVKYYDKNLFFHLKSLILNLNYNCLSKKIYVN